MTFEHIDTSCIDDESLPWMPFAPHSDLVSIKLFRADPERGEVISVLRAPPGVELPRYRHAGSATIYTVQGRWKYLERDWVAGPGSVVIETAASRHTPQVMPDGTDDVIMFIVTEGDLLLLDDDGNVVASENWRTAVDRYLEYCRANDIEPRDVTGSGA
jgi:2,4'-dihydroxyacetophenone dioxygenase